MPRTKRCTKYELRIVMNSNGKNILFCLENTILFKTISLFFSGPRSAKKGLARKIGSYRKIRSRVSFTINQEDNS